MVGGASVFGALKAGVARYGSGCRGTVSFPLDVDCSVGSGAVAGGDAGCIVGTGIDTGSCVLPEDGALCFSRLGCTEVEVVVA
jgi:hypothetical protein